MRPLRLMNYLSAREVIKMLPMTRGTFYRWTEAEKFGDLVKRDKETNIYYIHPENVPKLREIIQR